jgi:hypothetical protein
MNNHIVVGTPAYLSIQARVDYLDDLCSRRQLTVAENSELKRERAKLHAAVVRAIAARPQDDADRESVIAMLRNAGSVT